ncbi:MAG: 1-acyl-sn-glycerol-3-phosphate acyltransferase [Desulfobacteraceae bacterium]|nr:1-acyl-sn-glycerol-3-phosphate acyltransferase [Desulfobacteraceae bacterium]
MGHWKELTSRIHTVIIYIWVIFGTLIFALLAIAVSLVDRTGDRVHNVAQIWGRTILWVSLIRVRLCGASRIDPTRSYIFMANHQSNFDIPTVLGALPFQFRWLAKAELFRIPIFGRSMRGAGYISIDRSNRESAFRSLKQAAEIIRNGTSVLIFPEGTRSSDGRVQPFKKGGFVLAVDAGVPIVPIVIHGTQSIMPKHRLWIQPGPVKLEVLDLIETAGYTRRTKNELVDRVHRVLSEARSGGWKRC